MQYVLVMLDGSDREYNSNHLIWMQLRAYCSFCCVKVVAIVAVDVACFIVTGFVFGCLHFSMFPCNFLRGVLVSFSLLLQIALAPHLYLCLMNTGVGRSCWCCASASDCSCRVVSVSCSGVSHCCCVSRATYSRICASSSSVRWTESATGCVVSCCCARTSWVIINSLLLNIMKCNSKTLKNTLIQIIL